jgi:two-component system nitrogen regulation sensor histidine kinase GlnL
MSITNAVIIENLNTAILCFDKNFKLIKINPAAESLLEISAKKSLGLHVEKLNPEFKKLANILQRCLDYENNISEHSMNLYLFAERQITVDCSVTLIKQESKNIALLVELVQIDQQLHLTKEEAILMQHQATHNIIRGLAHEIRNPLSGIRGAAQLLELELDNTELHEYTNIVINEADRLQSLLNRMLGSQTLPNKVNINIHKVICKVQQLSLVSQKNNFKIINDFDPSIPDVKIDAEQLHQALLNIIRNAIKSMQDKKNGQIKIITRIQRKVVLGNKQYPLVARINIEDNGIGISEEIREQIFYPMVTGYADGTGLGLSITRDLLSKNNAFVACTNCKAGKTVFTIWLPILI